MVKPRRKGITRLVAATRYSWQGIRAAWRFEQAFRQEAVLVVIGFPLALLVADNRVEFLLLTLPLLLLLLTELANSAIEAVVDRFEDGRSELAGRAKDMGSAAVFMASLIAGLAWLTLLAPAHWY